MYRAFLFLCFGLIFGFCDEGQPSAHLLSRRVVLVEQDAPPAHYVIELFRRAKISGGVEEVLNGCSALPSEHFPKSDATVESALRVLNASTRRYKWKETLGRLAVFSDTNTQSLLDVTVTQYSYDRKKRRSAITLGVLALPEVRRRALELRLTQWTRGRGFAQINSEPSPGDIVTVRNIKLRDLLMRLSTDGEAWYYYQTSCGPDKSIYILEWAAL